MYTAIIKSDVRMVSELLESGRTRPKRNVNYSIEKLQERGYGVHFESSTGYIVLDSKWKDVETLALHWAGIDRINNIKPGELNVSRLEDRFTDNYIWKKYWNLEERYLVIDFFVEVYYAEAERLWQEE